MHADFLSRDNASLNHNILLKLINFYKYFLLHGTTQYNFLQFIFILYFKDEVFVFVTPHKMSYYAALKNKYYIMDIIVTYMHCIANLVHYHLIMCIYERAVFARAI